MTSTAPAAAPVHDQPAEPALPDGFTVELLPTTSQLEGGRLLVGGAPVTAMRLSRAAGDLLSGRRLTVTDVASAVLADRLLARDMAAPVVDDVEARPAEEMTVVVPVRDRAEQLDRCLAALGPLRVVVVDDASRGPGAVAAVATRHGAELVVLADNVGPAGARNAGLARVRTPLVAFVDSDVVASAEVLLQLTRQLADPSVALVGPRVVGRTTRADPRWFEPYDAAASSLDLGRRPGSVSSGAAVGWLPSACLVGEVARLGDGFDTRLRVGEDVDLVWRLTAAGNRVRYDPGCVVHHDVRPTLTGWLGRKVVYGSGGAELARRHPGQLAPAVLSPSMAVAGLALLSRRRWGLAVAGATVAHAAVSVDRALPREVPQPTRARASVALALQGAGWAVRQESSLLVRHWSPVSAVLLASRPGRRVMASALVIDGLVACYERRHTGLDVATLLVGRRLDDAAYGAGLWWGAWRARSLAALLPRRPSRPGGPSGAGRGVRDLRSARR
ncbi:mycofactocin biosynthesis glycosyltransferase MftF [Nocardioidaceae bacterium]|nr:mycofactocin biosynthesis glycosyltransferase MftF [Nocardioidaceae bacterium]